MRRHKRDSFKSILLTFQNCPNAGANAEVKLRKLSSALKEPKPVSFHRRKIMFFYSIKALSFYP